MKNILSGLLLLLGICSIISCAEKHQIKDRSIIFDEQRKQLSLEYLEDRYGLIQQNPEIEPRMVVLHWTVFPTFEEAFDAFKEPVLPDFRPDIQGASGLNVSSQFMVDRDGTIYRLMPETTMARHTIGLNHCAIGIENVGGTGDHPLTEAQLEANIWLVQYLSEKYPIEYVIGHYEYTNFEDHSLWLEKDSGYRTEKTDPGEKFMKAVREATKSYNFKPVPTKSKI